MNNKLLIRIAWIFCLLTAVVLCLKSLREPDLWWMYRTGEWMVENGQVTKQDPFSYTFLGTEWINVKWLFEVIISMGKALAGPEFIFVFQAMVALYILKNLNKTANLIRVQVQEPQNDAKSYPFAGLILAALLALWAMDFRMIGRPEMTSHLMVSLYVLIFLRHHYQPNAKIYALIPLQLIWTNMHEAFGIGMVLMVAYLAASWAQYIYQTKFQAKVKANMPKATNIAILGALAIVVVNPRGTEMWMHPFNIFGQLQDNKYTTELFSFWTPEYWQPEAYLNLGFAFLTAVFILLSPFLFRKTVEHKNVIETVVPDTSKKKKKKGTTTTHTKVSLQKEPLNWLGNISQYFSWGYLLIYSMLFYLSLTAYRNIPFFIIVSAPILAIAFQQLFNKIKKQQLVYLSLVILSVGSYLLVITGKYHELSNSRDQYGLQILASHNPTGAAQFLQKNKIKGRCFADYLSSAYLLWALQPDFKTYIDLRDLDIFSAEFFQEFTNMVYMPERFTAKDDSLNFDYVVLYRPQFQSLHKHLTYSDQYDLVFVDPVAAIYLKKSPKNQKFISQYGLKQNDYKDVFHRLEVISAYRPMYWLSKICNPLYSPTDYSEVDHARIAGDFYLSIEQYHLALQYAQEASSNEIDDWAGYELKGNIYATLAFSPITTDSLRQGNIQQAFVAYQAAIQLNPTSVNAYIGKAVLFMQQNDFGSAQIILEQAQKFNNDHLEVNRYLAICNRFLANKYNNDPIYVGKWRTHAEKLNQLNPNNPMIMLDLALAYCVSNNCEKARPYLDKVLNIPGLPQEDIQVAQQCAQGCNR